MTTERQELDANTHEAIKALCAIGDQLAGKRRFEEAIGEYNKAWELVPEPKNEWGASTWILAAIADACFLAGYKTSALEALRYVMTCPDAVGNPFLHLRLGQVLLDTGLPDAAAEELIRAYMGAGKEIFELEDPRYFEFLKSKANIQA
ncbi:tetratricopeptide repeat protein [Paraburkholderia sp. J10-1]|uniref:tetratricopeptide repeat protein n=1 Tax=Paraburkholderia sp. J10-1 TaxID=2805430 RepID=UPI002AB7B09D|nr:tetratricopeptide repeat protein [Paraburkholderia sp. J10-1]